MTTTAQQFLSIEAQAAAIQAQRATFEVQRHDAAEVEDWDTYDAAEAQIDTLSNQYMDQIQAMSAIAAQMTADDKAELKALRNG
jgi:hypothetical protein